MEGEGEVKVLGAWMSMSSIRVYIALDEKGIPYQHTDEDLQNKSQLLLQSNPIHKKILVLLHNGKPICESSIIVEYIDETWPSPPLVNPPTPYNRAIHRFWVDFIDKKFADAGLRIFSSPPGEVQDCGVKDLVEIYMMLEKALEEMACGKPFFGGESIGFVDVCFAPIINWFEILETIDKFKLPGEEKCPMLSAWVKKVLEVPSVKKNLPSPNKLLEYAYGLRSKILKQQISLK